MVQGRPTPFEYLLCTLCLDTKYLQTPSPLRVLRCLFLRCWAYRAGLTWTRRSLTVNRKRHAFISLLPLLPDSPGISQVSRLASLALYCSVLSALSPPWPLWSSRASSNTQRSCTVMLICLPPGLAFSSKLPHSGSSLRVPAERNFNNATY